MCTNPPELGSAMDASKLQECFNLARIPMDIPSALLKCASRWWIDQEKAMVFEEIERTKWEKICEEILDLKIVMLLAENLLGFVLYTPS